MDDNTLPVQPAQPGAGSSLLDPGTILAGKYRVERVLGSGGMGIVVAATHVELGQRVALKLLLPEALDNAEAVARFLREARAAVQIESEHVARVTDVGRLESGAPYMVMEYLAGSDLSQYPKGLALSVETAVDFVLQACEAIAIAHSLGIVHRDLKPANLFVTTRPDGSPLIKVLDFGISKLLEGSQGPALTRSAAVLGSPLFISPDQIESSKNVDARTDVWALGTILHELLADSPPFDGATVGAVFAAILRDPPVPLRTLRPDVPERLERVLLHALAKNPAQRIADVGQFALALAEFAPLGSRSLVERVTGVLNRAGKSHSGPPAPLTADAKAMSAATGSTWEDEPARPRRTRRSRFLVLAAAVIVAGGALSVLLARVLHWPALPTTVAEPASAATLSPARAVEPTKAPSAAESAAHAAATAPGSASALAPLSTGSVSAKPPPASGNKPHPTPASKSTTLAPSAHAHPPGLAEDNPFAN